MSTESTNSKARKTAGLPPGTLIYTGKKGKEPIDIELVQYSPTVHQRANINLDESISAHLSSDLVNFVSISGVHDHELIGKIGKDLNIHSLVLEDIVDVTQRPKLEVFEDYIFFSFRMLGISSGQQRIVSEQVSVILKDHTVLLFQEQKGDIFDVIRKRLEQKAGLIVKKGADFLLYRLLDTAVDHYLLVNEFFSHKLDGLEKRIMASPEDIQIRELLRLKKQIQRIRKAVFPLRDAINSFSNLENDLIDEKNKPYYKDIFDHSMEVFEMLELHREYAVNLIDLHQSMMSNQMNQVMKVLTIISTIFIPLSFIVGLYGMNFVNMPELQWEYGYYAVWAIIVLLIVGMMYYFKRKKWL